MKKITKRWAAMGLTGAMLLIGLTGCGGSSAQDTAGSGTEAAGAGGPKTLEIAVLTGMAPYTYVDDAGEFQGYDYEFLTKVDEKLADYEFHYNSVEPDAAAAAVQAGTYALSCSAHFVTPAREKNFTLSIPNCYYPVNLISRTEDNFKTFEDLDGAVMVPNPPNDGLYVVLHQMAEQYPDVKFTQEEVSNYVSYADSCRGVSNGTWDCWFGGDTMFYDVMEQEPMDNLVCSDPITCAPCVVVINKDMTDLRDAINGAIAELYEDGTLSTLADKWLGTDVFAIAEQTGALEDYSQYLPA